MYVVTGKSQSDRRRFFNNKMKSGKTKAFNEYNRLLRVLKKQNQFEQDQYNKLLFQENGKLKTGEPSVIIKCKEVIKQSNDSKTKDKLEDLIDEINENTIVPAHDKHIIPIESKPKEISMYPKSHVFTMKIIGKRGLGKTTPLIGSLKSLIANQMIDHENIWILCPKFDKQSQWTDTVFEPKNMEHLRINEQSQNKLLVSDDMQMNLKKNNKISEIFTRGSPYKIEIMKCEQFI